MPIALDPLFAEYLDYLEFVRHRDSRRLIATGAPSDG
jgi:hypothetical protein